MNRLVSILFAKHWKFPCARLLKMLAKTAPSSLRMFANREAKDKNTNIGYDVLADEYMDMVKGGVIDPAKVTRGALENAASIAAMILTTEALITDVPQPDAPAGGGQPQMPY